MNEDILREINALPPEAQRQLRGFYCLFAPAL